MVDAFPEYSIGEKFPTRNYTEAQKKALINYMNAFKIKAVAAGYFNDAVTGETKVGIDYLAFDDGQFRWTSEDTYHVEHYNLAANDDFLAAALAAAKEKK